MRTKFSANKSLGMKAVNASPIGDGLEASRPKGLMAKPKIARPMAPMGPRGLK
jgi:hypothetical protein